jgi:uncharacterized protein (DUF2267 family)
MDHETFMTAVERATGLSREEAQRAVDATLETLGERVSRGAVDDLMALLPAELRPALERGDALSHGAARPMSLRDFVIRIAEREGVTPDEAKEHARAVFAVLREAVGEKEFADVEAQLPDEYTAVLARS